MPCGALRKRMPWVTLLVLWHHDDFWERTLMSWRNNSQPVFLLCSATIYRIVISVHVTCTNTAYELDSHLHHATGICWVRFLTWKTFLLISALQLWIVDGRLTHFHSNLLRLCIPFVSVHLLQIKLYCCPTSSKSQIWHRSEAVLLITGVQFPTAANIFLCSVVSRQTLGPAFIHVYATSWTTVESWVRFPKGESYFYFSLPQLSRPAVRPALPPVEWLVCAVRHWGNWPLISIQYRG
jgi:hypothetical protein